jgi:predicted  nucleic acid-binding Zn-ribbon protein
MNEAKLREKNERLEYELSQIKKHRNLLWKAIGQYRKELKSAKKTIREYERSDEQILGKIQRRLIMGKNRRDVENKVSCSKQAIEGG